MTKLSNDTIGSYVKLLAEGEYLRRDALDRCQMSPPAATPGSLKVAAFKLIQRGRMRREGFNCWFLMLIP